MLPEPVSGSDAVVIPRSLLRAFATGSIAIWMPRAPSMRLRYVTIEREADGVIVEWWHRDALMLTRERLVTALCVEQSEEWVSGRRYLERSNALPSPAEEEGCVDEMGDAPPALRLPLPRRTGSMEVILLPCIDLRRRPVVR